MSVDDSENEIKGEVMHFAQNEKKPAVGHLLIAAADMSDPQFRHRVIFLCEHTTEGSFGLMINHPLSMKLSEVIEGNHSALPLYQGGPVQTNTLHYLHHRNDLMENSREVSKGIFWGSDFDKILAMADREAISETEIRFFAGYTGWGPGQLEEEVGQGSWYLLKVSSVDIFSVPYHNEEEAFWKQCLLLLGHKYEMLFNYPTDPSLN
jgi:putative transcriptional regulator